MKIDSFDPSNALLLVKYGGSLSSNGLTPTWFGDAMLKLSDGMDMAPDPSSVLLSLRHGTRSQISDWFATAMLKMSTSSVLPYRKQYPLPPKVLSSLRGYDLQIATNRLKELSVSVPHRPVLLTAPLARQSFPFPAQFKKLNKYTSSKSTTHPQKIHEDCVSIPILRNLPKVQSFIPPEFIDYGAHKLFKGFHVGKFTAYCPLSQTFDSYVCNDHGQYPWGHSHVKGAMAIVCQKLGIRYGSNVRNTCLPLHVLIGIIDNGIMEIDELVDKHRPLISQLLNSRSMRDGYPTIAKMFDTLGINDKVCLRIIDKIDYDTFTLLDRYFGDITKKVVYITHVAWHFFIAKLLHW